MQRNGKKYSGWNVYVSTFSSRGKLNNFSAQSVHISSTIRLTNTCVLITMFAQPTIEDDALIHTKEEIIATPTTVILDENEELETRNDENLRTMEQEMHSLADKVSVANLKSLLEWHILLKMNTTM